MAIDIKFDLAGNPEPPTIILATRNGNKLGQLEIDPNDIELTDRLSDISEFSFILNKHVNGRLTNLWDKVVDFKLVHCKEWDMWFEIKVELDEATETIKTVFCTQLGQAELSQIMLFDVELNTEKDIKRDDYKISILYDENDPEASILNRLLEKAPHYSIEYVDFTIANIQRSFSFNDTSIYDAFQEIAEEIGCLFVYNSNSDDNGKIKRTISVYDLQQKCLNLNCGYRGEFTDVCPKCGGTDIKYGYGEDTTIFVTSDELASEGIQLVTDTESVKNCFKLEAGDDLMTATIRNCNPNGTDYIWYFSESTKEDMPDELVEKLESYDELYKHYYSEYGSIIDVELVGNYNEIVNKYSNYNNDLQIIDAPAMDDYVLITGYSALMTAFYNAIDLALYLKSGLMPNIEMSETTAAEQAGLLTASSLSPVAVANETTVSEATANAAVLSMAKIIVKSTYKVQVKDSELSKDKTTWTGNFTITNYSDEEDTAVSEIVSIEINGDDETFIKQKIEKALNKENTDDYSISGLFGKEYNEFCAELKKYALNPLISFRDACNSCIDIMIEQGVPDNNTWSDNTEGSEANLYEKLYVPYYNKLLAIEAEIKIREDEVNSVSGVYDLDGNLIEDGLQTKIEECISQIQAALNFENYLGKELWTEFCAYRRECKYSNENYISDGLNNAELFAKANEFIDVAENEIYKSAELQHSISTTLNNLLAIPKFKPLVKYFKTGNWIRVRIDDKIYKLRLLEYTISYGSLDKIKVEFSDITKIKNSFSDIENILSQASSMASSYDSVQKQAKQGNEALGTIDEWLSIGLNTALVQIQSNSSEDIIINKNGILGRSYNEITDAYSPEQLRITHNILAYTTDNWKTVSSALGKHEYIKWQNNQWVKDIDYGLTSKFVSAGYVTGSQIIGGEIVSSNYKSGESGTYFNLIDGDFEIAGGNIVYDTNDDTLTLRNVTIEWANTNAPEVTINDVSGLDEYLEKIEGVEDQLDGRAQTWYQDTDPSAEWTTDELKTLHVGDLWHYTGETGKVNGVERIKNSEWIWQEANGFYQWCSIEISDAVFDVIDGKAQIFTSTPVPPYYIGDLWVQGSSGDIKHCIVSKAEGEFYSVSDWVKSSKYTDDTSLNEFIDGEFADELAAINSQVDKKAETWYQDTDPSLEWTTDELKTLHVGDLWFDTSKSKSYIYDYSYKWLEADGVPDEVFDAIDGKSTIYVSKPASQEVGDLLIPNTTFTSMYSSVTYTFTEKKIYRCTTSSDIFRPDYWIEVAYTDDTRANEAYELASSSKGIAENAAELGQKLSDGLGFKTEITGEYVISPVIAGGHLLIGDLKNTYAQITTDGLLSCANAKINGTVSSSTVEGSTIRGGDIYSLNYEEGVKGTHIDLQTGNFELGSNSIVYDGSSLTLNGVTINWTSTNPPEASDIDGLEDYLNQLDGRIQTFSQSEDPSNDWTTNEDREAHVGDLWFNPDDGLTKRWNGASWDIVTDSGLTELVQTKAQIFTATPVPPYYKGDLWVQGASGDIMHCITAKSEGESFSQSDWVKSSKYTDDTKALEALEKAKQGIADAASGISLAEAAQAAANAAQSTADGAVTAAGNAESNAKDYADKQDTSLSKTLTKAYETYTNSKISDFDSYAAQYLGLDGGTLIGENYMISPIITGGYLNITGAAIEGFEDVPRVIIDPNNLTGNNYIFQVHNGNQVSVGIDKDGNAEFSGTIAGSTIIGSTIISEESGSATALDGIKISNGTIYMGYNDEDGTNGASICCYEQPSLGLTILSTDKVVKIGSRNNKLILWSNGVSWELTANGLEKTGDIKS